MSEHDKHACNHSEAGTAKAWAKGAQDPVGEWGNAKVALDWSLEVEHYLPLAQRRQCLSPPVRCRSVRYAPCTSPRQASSLDVVRDGTCEALAWTQQKQRNALKAHH